MQGVNDEHQVKDAIGKRQRLCDTSNKAATSQRGRRALEHPGGRVHTDDSAARLVESGEPMPCTAANFEDAPAA
jgi:hypothetical protein